MDKPHSSDHRRGAGILVLAKDTGRFLALRRSDHVQHSRTWGLAGGLLDAGEAPEEGAAREFREETEYKGGEFTLVPLALFDTEKLTYNSYLAVVEHEFRPTLDHENEAFQWVGSLDDWPQPAHFGIEFLKKDAESMRIITAAQAACDHGQFAAERAKNVYAPTLYHVSHGPEEAQEISPDAAKGGLRATPNLREALPFLVPRGARFAAAPLPGTEEFIVIIPDRDAFLKSGGIDGVIFQVPGEHFEEKLKAGRLGRWVTEEKVPLSERSYFDRVQKLDAAMYYGLHILFARTPRTEEERAALEKAVKAPDFPANLKQMVREGTLTYENALRGINVSPYLQPEDAPPPPKGPNPRSIIQFKRWNQGH